MIGFVPPSNPLISNPLIKTFCNYNIWPDSQQALQQKFVRDQQHKIQFLRWKGTPVDINVDKSTFINIGSEFTIYNILPKIFDKVKIIKAPSRFELFRSLRSNPLPDAVRQQFLLNKIIK